MSTLSSKLNVTLRAVAAEDLPEFFKHQLENSANRMAAFTSKAPNDRAAFDAHWDKVLNDHLVEKRTIVLNGRIAGYLAKFDRFEKPEVCYWLGQEYWGKGVATEALRQFLEEVSTRPLYARVAFDNLGSIKVLEKCGFSECGRELFFANARGEEIEEIILELAAD